MPEIWNPIYTRGVASYTIWGGKPLLELRDLTLTQHTANVDALPVLARAVTDADAALSVAEEICANYFKRLRALNVQAPGAIETQLQADDPLHGQLDGIYAITSGQTEEDDLKRAGGVADLWRDFNTLLADHLPPKPAFTVPVGEDDLTLAEFEQLKLDSLAALNNAGRKKTLLKKAKNTLRVLARKVDRDNKRWYQTWTRLYPAGTPEGDAARENVPVEDHKVPPPTPLPIFSLTARPDHTVDVVYAREGGYHATKKELLYLLPGELEYGHAAEVNMNGQLIGPFPPNTLVGVRTRVGNSTASGVWGDIVQVLIPA